jgi:hypothetical protein
MYSAPKRTFLHWETLSTVKLKSCLSGLRWLYTLFIIGELVPILEFLCDNVKNICKNKYNFLSYVCEPQVMLILMFQVFLVLKEQTSS